MQNIYQQLWDADQLDLLLIDLQTNGDNYELQAVINANYSNYNKILQQQYSILCIYFTYENK